MRTHISTCNKQIPRPQSAFLSLYPARQSTMGDIDCGNCDCGNCDCDCGDCDCDCGDCDCDCGDCDCCDCKNGCCSCKCNKDCADLCCCMTCVGVLDDVCGDTCCGHCCDQLFRPTSSSRGTSYAQPARTAQQQQRPPEGGFPEPETNGYIERDLDEPPPSYEEVISSQPNSHRYGEVISSQPGLSTLSNSRV